MTAHQHKPGEPLDYNHIIDGIYAGTNQCCEAGLLEVLKQEGITADISLEDIRVDVPFGVEVYLWIPTTDHTSPSPDQLAHGIQTLAELVHQKRKVYVHCRNGHGRTTTLLSAFLISRGMSPQDAFQTIKAERPGVHLQPAQETALEAFAKEQQ